MSVLIRKVILIIILCIPVLMLNLSLYWIILRIIYMRGINIVLFIELRGTQNFSILKHSREHSRCWVLDVILAHNYNYCELSIFYLLVASLQLRWVNPWGLYIEAIELADKISDTTLIRHVKTTPFCAPHLKS